VASGRHGETVDDISRWRRMRKMRRREGGTRQTRRMSAVYWSSEETRYGQRTFWTVGYRSEASTGLDQTGPDRTGLNYRLPARGCVIARVGWSNRAMYLDNFPNELMSSSAADQSSLLNVYEVRYNVPPTNDVTPGRVRVARTGG